MVQRYTPDPFAAVADTPEIIDVDPDYPFTTLAVYACTAQGGKLADYTTQRGTFCDRVPDANSTVLEDGDRVAR